MNTETNLNDMERYFRSCTLGSVLIIRRSGSKWNIKALIEFLNQYSTKHNVKELDLHFCGVSDDDIKELVPVLAKNFPNLTKLNLSKNKIRDEGLKVIADNLPNLIELDLSCNEITTARALTNLSKLVKLRLSGNKLRAEGVKELASGNLSELTELDLDGNEIEDEGVEALGNGNLSKLVKLRLSGNKITAKGAKALANFSELTELDLYENDIRAEGVDVITNLSKLVKLKLGGNKIGNKGIKALLAAKLVNLTSLDFSSLYSHPDNIGVEGLEALALLQFLNQVKIKVNDFHSNVFNALVKSYNDGKFGRLDEETVKNLVFKMVPYDNNGQDTKDILQNPDKYPFPINSTDKNGEIILRHAVRRWDIGIIKFLLAKGVNPNIRDKKGDTVVDVADRESVKILIPYFVSHNPQAEKLKSVTNNAELSAFWDDCKNELQEMQNNKIGNSKISYYQFLIANEDELFNYLSNNNTYQELRTRAYAENRIYASVMDGQCLKGIRSNTLRIENRGYFRRDTAKNLSEGAVTCRSATGTASLLNEDMIDKLSKMASSWITRAPTYKDEVQLIVGSNLRIAEKRKLLCLKKNITPQEKDDRNRFLEKIRENFSGAKLILKCNKLTPEEKAMIIVDFSLLEGVKPSVDSYIKKENRKYYIKSITITSLGILGWSLMLSFPVLAIMEILIGSLVVFTVGFALVLTSLILGERSQEPGKDQAVLNSVVLDYVNNALSKTESVSDPIPDTSNRDLFVTQLGPKPELS
ncbi:hypothetical protein [Wolbachia endosymbiont of Ctenocephalides felis wCfeT]|uniref:hypothetical protein n=1 Tax=Wolbachia endosymbiont of Ctenocephalides felis wCfeT TaxID=2732593 RepID=UPI001444E891|nr:hypothetical protein [Wolbachia endosymbiont of Ctenocephalides felis wCfeT]